eukprot:TRINITY_DN40505_c0_g1_i1.p1 TRINITY_DN40505_c0_g1~~TRINITY_DN40505_c0_g1_i1.p1  ORF type:complete len:249 (-),score=79.87 TRINITY_DN40505_c0_g1_i1:11-757(-)
MSADANIRLLFERHADKFKRLNLSGFLSAFREFQADAPRTVSDETLPHTKQWADLQANSRTAMEKRELSVIVHALREEHDRLKLLQARNTQLEGQCTELRTQQEALLKERGAMQRELSSERAWLEAQLRDKLRSQTQEQSELRAQLSAQQALEVHSERAAKAAMRSQLEEEVGCLRAALEAQGSSHQRMLREQEGLVRVLQQALQEERCLLYTSDAADEEDSVDLGGRRTLKKKNVNAHAGSREQDNK